MTDDSQRLKRQAELSAGVRALPDEVLVAAVPHPDNWQSAYPGELQRRLLESNRELTVALRGFKEASDTASRRLLGATWVLIALTLAIVGLTIVWCGQT